MIPNRTRMLLMVLAAPGALVLAAFLAIIAEAWLPHTDFQIISNLLYVGAVCFAAVDAGFWLFFLCRAAWYEGSASRYIIAVNQDDRLVENLVFGDSIVRTSVTGNVTDPIIISQTRESAPYVQQKGTNFGHIVPEPNAEQRVDADTWAQMLHIYRQSKSNGKA
jgi:hypothetical protein